MNALFEHILVPVDYSEPAEQAAFAAARLAHGLGARLSLIHVFAPQIVDPAMPEVALPPITQLTERLEDRSKAQLQDWAERLRPLHAQIETTVVESTDDAATAILDFADTHGVDLIVLGSQERSGLTRLLLGSTTDKLVRRAHCAILVLKQEKPAAETAPA